MRALPKIFISSLTPSAGFFMEKNTQVYGNGNGEPGFNELMFKGKPVDLDNGGVSIAYFQHIFHTTYPDLVAGETREVPRRHRCLSSGYWCFENFRSNPKDIFDYLYIRSGLYHFRRFIKYRRWT